MQKWNMSSTPIISIIKRCAASSPYGSSLPMQRVHGWRFRAAECGQNARCLRGSLATAGQRAGQAACSARGCCRQGTRCTRQLRRRGRAVGKPTIEILPGCLVAGGAARPGTAPAPRPCRSAAPAGQSRCRRKPVRRGLHLPAPAWQGWAAPLRPKQAAAGRSTAYTPPQPAAAARGRGRLTQRVAALHAGQYGSAQKQVEQCIPRTHRAKRPRPGRPQAAATAAQHLNKFYNQLHGSRSSGSQNAMPTLLSLPHCLASAAGRCTGAQKGCGNTGLLRPKVGQQQLVQIDHGFHTRSLSNSSIFQFRKKHVTVCKKRRTVQKQCFYRPFSQPFFTFFSKKYLNISGKCGILLPS